MRLIQLAFGDGTLPEDLTWVTMVLLPKGKEKYRGTGLVEVTWTVCTLVVNFLLNQSFKFHDALHGFRDGRGTGMDTLEAKMAHQLSGLAYEPLFQVFLDV